MQKVLILFLYLTILGPTLFVKTIRMLARLLSLLCLTTTLVAQTVSPVWTNVIQEHYNYGMSRGFMFTPRVISDGQGNLYQWGFAGAYGHALAVDDIYIPSQTPRRHPHYLVQYAPDGQLNWLRTFSGWRDTAYDLAKHPHVIPKAEGGVTLLSLVSYTVVYGEDTLAVSAEKNKRLLVAEIDPAGDLVSWQLHDASSLYSIHHVIRTANGDLIATGEFYGRRGVLGTDNLNLYTHRAKVNLRLSANGEQILWYAVQENPNPNAISLGHTILSELADGSIALVRTPMYLNSTGSGCVAQPLSLQLLDGNTGELKWERTIAIGGFHRIDDIKQAENGDLYLAGFYQGVLFTNNGQELFNSSADDRCLSRSGVVLQVDRTGQVVSVNELSEGFEPKRIILLDEHYYLLAGLSPPQEGRSHHHFQFDFFTYDHEPVGQVELAHTIYRHANLDVVKLSDRRLLFTCTQTSDFLDVVLEYPQPPLFDDIFIVSVLDLDMPRPEPLPPTLELSLFPNPASVLVNVRLPEAVDYSQELVVYDFSGRVVATETVPPQRLQYPLWVADLPAGAYIIKLGRSGEGGPIARLLKQ
jgi:hypothetical protein